MKTRTVVVNKLGEFYGESVKCSRREYEECRDTIKQIGAHGESTWYLELALEDGTLAVFTKNIALESVIKLEVLDNED